MKYPDESEIVEVPRTRAPRTYYPASNYEIRKMAKRFQVEDLSTTLFHDLANICAGGTMLDKSALEMEIRVQVEQRYPKRYLTQEYALPDGETTNDRSRAIRSHSLTAIRYNNRVWEFLSHLSPWEVPGRSPLERGMLLYKVLLSMSGDNTHDGKRLKVLMSGVGSKIAADVQAIADAVGGLDSDERKLLEGTESAEAQKDSDEDAEGESNSDEDDEAGTGHYALKKRTINFDMLNDPEKLAMLSISRKLDEFARMRIERGTKFVPDPLARNVRMRPIKALEELPQLNAEAWALHQRTPALFWYRAVTGQLQIRERGQFQDFRQLVYLLIDSSGSMGIGQRIAKACGILMNRLKGVVAQDAEVYFCFFDDDTHPEKHVCTTEEAQAAMRDVIEHNYSGGGTNIDKAIRKSLKRIDAILEETRTIRPELVVISDGGDTVCLTERELGETKLHLFMVEGKNPRLEELAKGSGGVVMHIN